MAEHAPKVDLMELAVKIVDCREGGYSYEFAANPEGHRGLYEVELEALIVRCEWVTPSGRRWSAKEYRWRRDGEDAYTMSPKGDDVFGFGGVKAVVVVASRLDGFDRIWRPIPPRSEREETT